jgi:hypothetical protein
MHFGLHATFFVPARPGRVLLSGNVSGPLYNYSIKQERH